MYQYAAIAVATAWLACFAACAAFCRTGHARTAAARAGRRHGEQPACQPPALLSLVASGGKLTGAAYCETVLDLAARGHLELAGQPGNQWGRLPAGPASRAGLLDFEMLVLRDAASTLNGTGGAPLDALAGACWADPQGRWNPFEQAVRAEARRRGLIGSGVPPAVRTLLQAGAFGIAGLTYLALHAHSPSGFWLPSITAFLVLVTPSYWLGNLAAKDRPTRSGHALARQSAARLADPFAGPASQPGAAAYGGQPGTAAYGSQPGAAAYGGQPGTAGRPRKDSQPAEAGRPATAWSSLSGEWRQVQIEPVGTPLHVDPAFLLIAAVWAGILAVPASMAPDPAGFLIASSLASVAIILAATAMGIHTRRLALPAVTEFDGQVIARWIEKTGEDYVEMQCVAVDDGSRAWSFEIKGGTFRSYAAGVRVRVRMAPRKMKLLGLTVLAAPAAPAAGAQESSPWSPG